MSTTLKTTGDLRKFIAKAMEDVVSGTLDCEKAARVQKLGVVLNESFYSEVKVAQVVRDLGGTPMPLGELLLCPEEPAK